jgi:DNA polymerase-3 subunit delta'
LLTGPPGVGKATLAYRLARRLLSANGDPNDPRSAVFNRIAKSSHADVLTIERVVDDKRKRMRSEILVDQVRAAPTFLHLTPAEGGWRVVIVDGAEDMNRNGANALLKILEEPPRRAILFLTSDAPGRLLPTVRSRCRRLMLNPLDAAAMADALAYLMPEMDAGERTRLARVAEGSPGRAVALAEEGGLAVAELVTQMLREAPTIPIARMYDVADRAMKTETGFATFMELLQAGLAHAVRDSARGVGQGALPSPRPLAEWGEVWHALGRLQDETERFNLDKRTAIVAGLELLSRA